MMKYYHLTNQTNYLINFIFMAICYFFGRPIISIFTQDPTIIEMAYVGLNIVNAAFIIIGLNLNTTIYYQAIETPKYSNIICACRSIIFLPIVLFMLTNLFGTIRYLVCFTSLRIFNLSLFFNFYKYQSDYEASYFTLLKTIQSNRFLISSKKIIIKRVIRLCLTNSSLLILVIKKLKERILL